MNKAIGVIDSGVGGLTVAHEIMRQLPNENIIYLGDTIRCPYGSRTELEVITFTRQMVNFLIKRDVKLIVIACNTATAFALDIIRREISVPIIGVIQPGARAAINATETKQIGVIGTEGTIHSHAYKDALEAIDRSIEVHSLPCPLFVPMVEKGILQGSQAEEIIEDTLRPFLSVYNFDTLILGCTHYPLLETAIQKVVGKHITLISSSEETARETSTILDAKEMTGNNAATRHHEFYATGELLLFQQISEHIFHKEIKMLKKVQMDNAVLV